MKPNYSQKILKILNQKRAISDSDLVDIISPEAKNTPQKARTAIKRSMTGLVDTGLVTTHFSGQGDFFRITPSGRKRALSQSLDDTNTLVPNWDGQWRMILLDLPESRKSEREALRYLLKKAGFICLKNSVWVSYLPYEHMFTNIKSDLGLTTEMMVLVTATLDPDTTKTLYKEFFGI